MSEIRIIAEAGVNHNGSVPLAKEMIRRAADCGADIIKFQTFEPQALVTRSARKAAYQEQATGSSEGQLAMLQKLQLPREAYPELMEECRKCGVEFLSTPFDLSSIRLLEELKIGCWKVPSGEITNLPYLQAVAQTGKPVILSTGMAELCEVERALEILRTGGAPITLLHCTTEYPAPFGEVNLRAMWTLREHFSLPVGYSDHTEGIEIPIAAAALGAVILEKHFTLDQTMPGPDHRASLEPKELRAMVKAVRHIEAALGDGKKQPAPSEIKNRQAARKSIVAARPIAAGEPFTEQNLTVKRPGTGISPMRWYELLGKAAKRDFEEDELIEL